LVYFVGLFRSDGGAPKRRGVQGCLPQTCTRFFRRAWLYGWVIGHS